MLDTQLKRSRFFDRLSRSKAFIKRNFDFAILAYGLGLIIDNWNHNHTLLLAPGYIMLGVGLRWVITNLIDERMR